MRQSSNHLPRDRDFAGNNGLHQRPELFHSRVARLHIPSSSSAGRLQKMVVQSGAE
jgi:hypothetical protein